MTIEVLSLPQDAPLPSSLFDFQNLVTRRLQTVFAPAATCSEWRTQFGPHVYSPRLDVAVGPFALGDTQFRESYNEMARTHRNFLAELHGAHLENIAEYRAAVTAPSLTDVLSCNENARCFMGIEIENRVTRKHLMGGALNVSSLSRVAIIVGWTPDKVRALLKLKAYFDTLARVGKPTFYARNLLILGPWQLWGALLASPCDA